MTHQATDLSKAQKDLDALMEDLDRIQNQMESAPVAAVAPTPLHVVEGGSAVSEGDLTLSIKGNMNLNLEYAANGFRVTVSFQDSHLLVKLSDGAEIKIPLSHRD